MILRRLSSALKRQDWATVLIEFVLVIVGVLIALQVNNWNQNRQDRRLEVTYLNSLYAEVTAVIPPLRELLEEKEANLEALSQTIQLIDTGNTDSELSPLQCHAIFESHIYDVGKQDLPTVTEIFASGRIALFRDERLRAALVTFQQSYAVRESRRQNILGGQIISREYPEVIKLNPGVLQAANSGNEYLPACDFRRMLGNEGLRNDLIDNGARLSANANFLIRDELSQLERIQLTLSDILGVEQKADNS